MWFFMLKGNLKPEIDEIWIFFYNALQFFAVSPYVQPSGVLEAKENPSPYDH